MSDIQLFNKNCFDVFPTLEDKSINLFVLDLPFGCTACKWDSVIDLEEMWKHIKRIMKPNAILVFFCTAKFGYTLIHSNPKWFKYDLIWKKSRKVGFLSANKQPLRQHELMYVFKKEQGTYHPQKTEGKPYKMKEGTKLENNVYGNIIRKGNNEGDRHPTSIIDHESMYIFNDKPVTHSKKEHQEYSTYNPQKTEGKPFKVKGGKSKAVNGSLSRGHEVISKEYENKGDRHPTSIIDHESMYVFKDKQGTYNPQKTKGKAYNKTNTGNNNKDSSAYGIIDRSSHLEGEGNRAINKGERHPTSIIDHENIYVFDNPVNEEYKPNDIELSRNIDIREYVEKVYKFIGKTKKQIIKKIGQKVDHYFRFKSSQFALCTNETYNELIKEYNINEMEDYLEYNILVSLWEKPPPQPAKNKSTYNPQKTEGKPYKNGADHNQNNVYGITKEKGTEIKTDRHPTSIINEIPEYEGDSILVYKNPHKTIHRTQKPVELLEWLIKTYSNEGDTVMDFTMGSGTAGIGCINTKRKFIGVEMDEEIFKLAEDRIENHKKNM